MRLRSSIRDGLRVMVATQPIICRIGVAALIVLIASNHLLRAASSSGDTVPEKSREAPIDSIPGFHVCQQGLILPILSDRRSAWYSWAQAILLTSLGGP